MSMGIVTLMDPERIYGAYCSHCHKALDYRTIIVAWGPICSDKPEHRHLMIGSECCHAAIVDRPSTEDIETLDVEQVKELVTR